MIETVPPGTVLHGRYRIERVLGSGGFGHVYLAVDLGTNQQYAVKEYLVTGASGQEQLKHEANVLSQLRHPNLPAFQDAFMERGRYYMVLNYIEGNDLTDLIRVTRQRNEAIPIARIMGWALSICDAVMFLHSQHPSVIHRDIKPDNIRIMPNGTALLVDLGNAKAAADGARTLFFIRHQGTPGYAPPEQYPGGSGTDTRSDVYALGGTLYFALTAYEPPSVSMRNQSLQQGQPDLPSLQERLANNPPEESDANAGRQFRLGVSRPAKPALRHSRHLAQLGTMPPELLKQLNRIIQKAMAMKPKDRYQYVADLANDLRRVLAALPSAPQTPSPRQFDPNSTQPDLPGIYEAIQAAKDNAAQGALDARSDIPPSPPGATSPPAQTASAPTVYCPRCSSPISPNASFCPRCGSALSGQPANHGPNPGPSSRADNSIEETLVVSPAQIKQASMAYAQAQRAVATPSVDDTMNQSGKTASQHGLSLATQAPPVSIMSGGGESGNVQQSLAGGPEDEKQARMRTMLKILLMISIVLLVLIVVMILLLSNHSHHLRSDVFSLLPGYGLSMGEKMHGRNLTFGAASITTFAVAGLRQRHPGVSAIARLL